MDRIIAVVSGQETAGAVLSTAHALARRIDGVVQSMRTEQDLSNPQCAARIIEAARGHDVGLLVLPPVGQRALPISLATEKPLVLTARTGSSPTRINRLLIPHDGQRRTGMALAERFASAHTDDLEVLLLHVLDEKSLPSFADEFETWIAEFRRRYATFGGRIRVEVRRGSPALMVLTVAEQFRPDLIVLGWSRQLAPGKAATLRQVLEHSPAAMMVLPAPVAEPAARLAWPSQVSQPAVLRA